VFTMSVNRSDATDIQRPSQLKGTYYLNYVYFTLFSTPAILPIN